MNAELLYEALSDTSALAQLNEYDLKRLVSAHPYFSIAQLLLAKKYREADNKDSYQQQREHVQAFYRNPWWLFYQLELSDQSAHRSYAYTHAVPFQPVHMAPVAHAGTASPSLEDSAPEPEPAAPEMTFQHEEITAEKEPVNPFEGPVAEIHEGPEVVPSVARHAFVPWPGMEESGEIPTLKGTGILSAQQAEQTTASVEAVTPQPEIPKPFLPYMVRVAMGEESQEAAPETRASTEARADALAAQEAAFLAEPEELPLEEEDEVPPSVTSAQAEAAPLSFPSGEPAPFPFSVTPLAHDFAFEPLHTVDYFASQGIKLDLEENPTDNLTRHLKSFTEWLKTMKRINPMDTREDLDAATEAEIQLLASSANRQKEAVVTESMAHVWVLQGKVNKAIEVYHKLSLQHPEKRAYFASKIDQLNRL